MAVGIVIAKSKKCADLSGLRHGILITERHQALAVALFEQDVGQGAAGPAFLDRAGSLKKPSSRRGQLTSIA